MTGGPILDFAISGLSCPIVHFQNPYTAFLSGKYVTALT